MSTRSARGYVDDTEFLYLTIGPPHYSCGGEVTSSHRVRELLIHIPRSRSGKYWGVPNRIR